MPAALLKITYVDENRPPIQVKVTPRAQVNTETHIGGDWARMGILSLFHMAWGSLKKVEPDTPDFETWLDTIENVEEIEPPKADPTPPAPSEGASSL